MSILILDSIGSHSELHMTSNDPEKDVDTFFPATTADDVYMNENFNTLSQFIPTITPSDPEEGECPMSAEEDDVITVSDSLANLLLGDS